MVSVNRYGCQANSRICSYRTLVIVEVCSIAVGQYSNLAIGRMKTIELPMSSRSHDSKRRHNLSAYWSRSKLCVCIRYYFRTSCGNMQWRDSGHPQLALATTAIIKPSYCLVDFFIVLGMSTKARLACCTKSRYVSTSRHDIEAFDAFCHLNDNSQLQSALCAPRLSLLVVRPPLVSIEVSRITCCRSEP